MPLRHLPASLSPHVSPQPSGKCSFIDLARRKIQDGLSGVFLAGIESEAVEFEEQNTDYETGALVAIEERMVADNTGAVKSGHCDDVGTVGIRMVLSGTRQSGLQKPSVAQPGRTAVDGHKAVVDRQNVTFLDPDRFFPSAHCRLSLCQGVERIAIAGHDLFGLGHFLLESGIVRG